MSAATSSQTLDAIVIGGGAAGVGVSIALRHAGIENFLVLERHMVGASFALWPSETRFITPSFPTNSIGMLDLNSIAIGISPAFSLGVEHPTGKEFAVHLQAIAKFFQLPVREKTNVLRVSKIGDDFLVDTPEETLRSKHLIWAAGEFQYPQLAGFAGSELCQHTATIPSYQQLEGDDFIVIGGYESGVDAAYHLACREKKVRLFDTGCPWTEESSDPSLALSTYSQERMRDDRFAKQVELYPEAPITSVTRKEKSFEVTTRDGAVFNTPVPPILAGGFMGSHRLVADLFEDRADGFPLLNERDESTVVPGLFLCGPAVRHQNHVFCFIYKYRQRFAVVAKAIADSMGLPAEELESYRQWGMYLDDLSCCGEECSTC
ncbi:MAG: NAD(P)/FAD-dependent oxidoreductase [Planctomycetota bacterium]|nr:NAD(P)/FAD-dependent oxidoreductase [Planctomycetota bacterium]